DNASHDRVHLIGVILHEGLDRREALSYPRPFIKQFGRAAKYRKINLHPFAAQLLEFPHRFRVQLPGFFIPEKLELFISGHAEPELDPPEINRSSNTLEQAPNGERVPTNPVANWSMLVLPIKIAPASSSRFTTVALAAGV